MADTRPLAEPYRLRCLGPVSFTAPDGAARRFRTRKQMALVLVLALRAGRPHGREHFVDLLWSQDDPRAARHSLAQSISLVNKLMGCDAIELAGKDQVRLREGLVWLDVDAFEAAASAGRHADARALWRGNLLEGLWVRSAPGFERWLESERQRLVRVYRDVLHHGVEAERAAGDWGAMRRTAEALLASDPLDETAMLADLEAVALGGDRTLALRGYVEFERRLDEELGASPGPALKSWAKRQRQGDATAAAPAPAPRIAETFTLPTPRPVFGREEEFAFLWDGWNAAQRNDGRFVILEGVAGIGKSALATKLANQVHVAGGSVCFARCWRTEKSVPFAPITAIIRQLMRLPGFVALDEVWISELSRLVPELRERYPTVPPPMAVDDSARHRICDATLQAADCVAYESPLLIIVDDIQNADEATLALLHYFGRQTADKPTMLLCTNRTGAAESGTEKAFLEAARYEGVAAIQELGRLPRVQAAKIVQHVLAGRGLEAPQWAVAKLCVNAEGNPLRLIEAAMAVPGRDTMDEATWLSRLATSLAGNEASFEQSSLDRFDQLPEGAKLVAGSISVAGRAITDHELCAITGLTPSLVASAILTLEEEHFVRREGGQVALEHDLYRSLNTRLGSQTRTTLHATLARELVKSAGDRPTALCEVAWHYEEANDPEAARTWALRAADFAASVGASREHVKALTIAVRIEPNDWDHAAQLAESLLTLHEHEEATTIIARALHSSLPNAHAAEFEYLRIAAGFASGRLNWVELRDALRDLTERCTGFRSAPRALFELTRAQDKAGCPAAARETAKRMRRRFSSSRRNRAYAIAATAFIAMRYYSPRRGAALFTCALREAKQASDWDLELSIRQGLGAALIKTGAFKASVEHLTHGVALSRMRLNPIAEAHALTDRVCSELALGEFEAASRSLAMSQRIAEQYQVLPLKAYNTINAATLSFLSGSYEQAAGGYEEAHRLAASAGIWWLGVSSCAARALCGARLRKQQDLAAWLGKAEALIDETQGNILDSYFLEAARAWRLADLGDAKGAILAIRRAADHAQSQDVEDWLRLELESVLLKEHLSGKRDPEDRCRVSELAEKYAAKAVVREASC